MIFKLFFSMLKKQIFSKVYIIMEKYLFDARFVHVHAHIHTYIFSLIGNTPT